MSALWIPLIAWGFMMVVFGLQAVAMYAIERITEPKMVEARIVQSWNDEITVEIDIRSNQELVFGKGR